MKKTTGKRTSPANNYLLIVTNKNTRKRCNIYSKSAIKTAERHANDAVFMSFLLTLNIFCTFS